VSIIKVAISEAWAAKLLSGRGLDNILHWKKAYKAARGLKGAKAGWSRRVAIDKKLVPDFARLMNKKMRSQKRLTPKSWSKFKKAFVDSEKIFRGRVV
jgi:hypothetical protein